MLTLVLLLIFLLVAGLVWLQGFWNSAVTLINFVFAAMLALNYFEPIAAALAESNRSYTYLWDSVVFWILFAFCFGFLRLFTDLLSRKRVKFNIWVEMIGRSVLALWIGWMFVGLVCVSLHIGPLPPHPLGSFQQTPTSGNFLGFAPGKQWFAFMQSRSQGALSNNQVFDPNSTYIWKYYQRRVDFAEEQAYRVSR